MINDDYGLGVIADQERWRWDLNPRKDRSFTRFRGVRPRPLGDSTADEPTGGGPLVAPPPKTDSAL
jgi:hypothetical protein